MTLSLSFRKLRPLIGWVALFAGSCSQKPAAPAEARAPSKERDKLHSVDLREVKVSGEIGRRIEITIKNHLLKIDLERDFLQPFRDKDRGVSSYVGMGKLVDAAVRLAAYSSDQEVINLKERLVSELIRLQEPDGYLGVLKPELRMWYLWDVHEMSYIVWGLTSDYMYFGKQASLASARGVMDYMVRHWKQDPDRPIVGEDLNYWLVATGFEPAVMALYNVTGDRKYLDFAIQYRRLRQWDEPIVIGRHGKIEGHVYPYLARCLAQQELYRLEGGADLLGPSRKVVNFISTSDGMFVSGACGNDECWRDDQETTKKVGETCTSAHLIYFSDSLLRLEGNPYHGDLIERILYNTLFAAQSPEGRRLRYYTAVDGPRGKYFEKDGFCCPGNFRRIISDLPRFIYYKTEDGLVVNLYTDSTVSTELRSGLKVKLRQQTDYPNSGIVRIVVEPGHPARFGLKLRIPRWAENAELLVNDEPSYRLPQTGVFHEVVREWRSGDTVELHMPMSFRFIRRRKKQEGYAAIMRGPVVFTFAPTPEQAVQFQDFRNIKIDPTTIEGPLSSDRVRPGGLACRVKTWTTGSLDKPAPNTEIVLTEFPDPDSTATYFLVADPVKRILREDALFVAARPQ